MSIRWVGLGALLCLVACASDPEPEPDSKPAPTASSTVDPLAPAERPSRIKRRRPTSAPASRPTGAGAWPAPERDDSIRDRPEDLVETAPVFPAGERRIHLVLQDVEFGEAVEMLAQLAGVRITVTQPLAKPHTVSLTLKDEPWRRALERVLAAAGEFQLGGQGNLIEVTPRSTLVSGTLTARDGTTLTVRRDGDVPSTVILVLPEGPEGSPAAKTAASLKPLFDALPVGARVVARCQLVGKALVVTSLASR